MDPNNQLQNEITFLETILPDLSAGCGLPETPRVRKLISERLKKLYIKNNLAEIIK